MSEQRLVTMEDAMSEGAAIKGNFPKAPDECEHRHWSQVIDLATGAFTGERACWACGMREAVRKSDHD